MNSKNSSVCKKCLKTEKKFSEKSANSQSKCKRHKNSKQKNQTSRFRTSTPIAELENSPGMNFSDSVSDFFYQSWKSGLYADDAKTYQTASSQVVQQPYVIVQPFFYAPQIVYVNTVIYQPYVPVQQVGYRSDGTFGVLPVYWLYN